MKRVGQVVMVCFAAVTLACDANTRRENGAIGTAGVSDADADFVADAATAGMTEVRLGELAQQNAQSNDVKQFAEMMVRDHTKGGEALKQVATQHSIRVPSQPKEGQSELVNHLSQLRGADFDREYMEAMVDNHEDVVDLLQSRANEDRVGEGKGTVRPERSDDPVEAALNQWAAKTLPTTRHHLDEARRVRESLGNRLTTRSNNEPAK
jgi:putative membrane protein